MRVPAVFPVSVPELPQVPDLVAALAAWLAGEAIKRIATGRTWETTARRLLPLIVPAVGAGVRVAVSAAVDGADWKTSLLRGAIAGGAAVYAQQLRTATKNGDVGTSTSTPE